VRDDENNSNSIIMTISNIKFPIYNIIANGNKLMISDHNLPLVTV